MKIKLLIIAFYIGIFSLACKDAAKEKLEDKLNDSNKKLKELSDEIEKLLKDNNPSTFNRINPGSIKPDTLIIAGYDSTARPDTGVSFSYHIINGEISIKKHKVK